MKALVEEFYLVQMIDEEGVPQYLDWVGKEGRKNVRSYRRDWHYAKHFPTKEDAKAMLDGKDTLAVVRTTVTPLSPLDK